MIQLFRAFKIIIDFVSRFKIIIIHRIWDAYDNFFNHLESQQTEAKKIDRHFWISELNRTIKTKHVKLIKYNDKIKHSYERFLNFATILDLEVKLNLYAICNLLSWFFFAKISIFIKNEMTTLREFVIDWLIDNSFFVVAPSIGPMRVITIEFYVQ